MSTDTLYSAVVAAEIAYCRVEDAYREGTADKAALDEATLILNTATENYVRKVPSPVTNQHTLPGSRLEEAKKVIERITYGELGMISNTETLIETGWRALADGSLTLNQQQALKRSLVIAETNGKSISEFALIVADIAHLYGMGIDTLMKKKVQRQRLITLSSELGSLLTMERV